MSWNVINKVQTGILRTTNQQSATDAGLLYTAPSYTIHSTGERGGTASVAEVTKMTGLAIRRFKVFNSAGGTLTVGIGYRLHNRYWKCGVTDGTTFTDDTADAQDLGANDVIIGANDADGNSTEFVIFSPIPFNWFSMNVGTAEVNAAGDVDHLMQFSDAAGTGWTTIATTGSYLDNLTLTNTVIGAGAREFAWPGNPAWGRVVSLGGIPAGNYAMRIETAALDATDTAATVNAIEVGTMIFKEGILTNTSWDSGDMVQFKQHEADAVVAFFSTADPLNTVYAEVTTF